MEENNSSASHSSFPSEERSQISSVHQGGPFIVKLNNSTLGGHNTQIYPNFVAQSIENSVKDNEGGNEIAFEIIQEPLLHDSVVDNNRLFFETDYSIDKATNQQKEAKSMLGELPKNKEDSIAIITRSGEKENSLSSFALKEVLATDGRYDLTSASPVAASSVQSQAPSFVNKRAKVEYPDPVEDKGKVALPETIKKTMVEGFVKMIVCRKITIQKQDARTGDILDVDVKLEEDEPVVLGVDYVETTEDILSGHVSKSNNDSFKGSVSSAVEGGFKVLKAVQESNPNISKNLLSNSVLQSTLHKGISKVLQRDKSVDGTQINSSGDATGEIVFKVTEDSDAKNNLTIDDDSDSELVKGFDDDSADYNPGVKPKSKQPVGKWKKALKNLKSANKHEENSESSFVSQTQKKDSDICIPKKRGRKRKWDRTIGLAPNLKTCQFCNKNFDSVTNCNKHMKKGDCVSAEYCFICSKTFDSEQQLETHIASHRDESRSSSFDCADCHRSYRTKAGYVKHFRMGTCKKRENFEDGETGDYICEFCDSRFTTQDYLLLHQYKVHENPKDRHLCPDCGKTFYSLQGFQRHRSGRPCTEPLKCHICGKTYKAKESFKLHMKHHKSEITGITYNCDECGRSYMTETALTKHKLLHTGVKPYKCDICGKEFAMRYQVKDHARMHSGEKPYSCNLCGVAFSNKGHLGRHIRSHENGTLFRRGRPRKIQSSGSNNGVETEIKVIDLGQTLQTIDGQTIQVVDGQIFNSQGDGPPMIIQADTNTIIIAEGWQNNSVSVSQSQATVVGQSNCEVSLSETETKKELQ